MERSRDRSRHGGRPYLAGLPELDLFESDEQRRETLRQIEGGMMPTTAVGWVAFVVVLGGATWLVFRLMVWLVMAISPLSSTVNGWIALAFTTIACTAIVLLLIRRDHARAGHPGLHRVRLRPSRRRGRSLPGVGSPAEPPRATRAWERRMGSAGRIAPAPGDRPAIIHVCC